MPYKIEVLSKSVANNDHFTTPYEVQALRDEANMFMSNKDAKDVIDVQWSTIYDDANRVVIHTCTIVYIE